MSQGALPGFRDFYPEQLAERTYLMAVWRDVAQRYGFVEYDGPPLESLDLYTKKSGEEIVGQLYTFTDKGQRQVALRPDMTPTLARMVGAKANAMRKPVKWFSIPQLFRYERQQRGRLREHFQLNVDILGESDVSADAELLSVALEVMRSFGLKPSDVSARVSDRRLFRAVMLSLGVTDALLPRVTTVVDKLDRIPLPEAHRMLSQAGIDESLASDITRTIHSATSVESLRSVFQGTPDLDAQVRMMEKYFGYLAAMGLRDWVKLDLRIVRGLDYYTGIVFELFDNGLEHRAICGGGRYDQLIEAMGGPPLPALGFGMGDVVLGALLKERGLIPKQFPHLDYWVAWTDESLRHRALEVASILRRKWKRRVDYALRSQPLTKQLDSANAAKAEKTLIIGNQTHGTVKWMRHIRQRQVHLDHWLAGKELMASDEGDFFIGKATFTPTTRVKSVKNPLAE